MALRRRSFNATATTTTHRQNETITSVSAHPSSLRTPGGSDFGGTLRQLATACAGNLGGHNDQRHDKQYDAHPGEMGKPKQQPLTLDHAWVRPRPAPNRSAVVDRFRAAELQGLTGMASELGIRRH